MILSLQTSIIAVEFDGGVVLGADSRTTTGYVNKQTLFTDETSL